MASGIHFEFILHDQSIDTAYEVWRAALDTAILHEIEVPEITRTFVASGRAWHIWFPGGEIDDKLEELEGELERLVDAGELRYLYITVHEDMVTYSKEYWPPIIPLSPDASDDENF